MPIVRRLRVVLLLPMVAGLVLAQKSASTSYVRSIHEWQQQRAKGLMAEEGWFSLAGLFWLKSGANSMGSAKNNDIVLPASAPEKLGTLELKDGRVHFVPVQVFGLTINGRPAASQEMKTDDSGRPDKLKYKSLTMFVIQRGEKYGLRLKDDNSDARRNFHGLKFFPVDPRWRVQARFVPYDPPKQITIPTILGTTIQMPSPGRVEFTLNGKQYSLDPVLEAPDSKELFFIFRDATSRSGESYGAGRFLYTALPENAKLTLDFNRAENPPCAYTPYATCPLPPPENKLPIAVRAGEKSYGKH